MTAGDDFGAPSMDAILASIKRIIAEGDDPPATGLRRVSAVAVPEDVLELTEEAGEGDTLVSPVAADTSRASLDVLSAMVVTTDPKGAGTLDALVRDMLRPMLAEWLDAKLPAMVERLVAAEIERIASRN